MGVPTVRRRRLGRKLRELRADATLEEIAEAAEGAFNVSKLSRLEGAKTAAKAADVERLLDLYGSLGRTVSPELRAALLDLTREGAKRGWWQSYRAVLSPVYEDLISLEDEASSVRTWQMGVIPGLLQTGEYARAFMRAISMSDAIEERIDALVEVRLARQAVLTRRDEPLKLWAIIGEAALHTRCGEGVMRDQLGRLLSLAQRPNITVQVLPFDASPHVGQMGAYAILGFNNLPDLDVVHVESLTSALYVEDADQVAVHGAAFEQLQAAALPVDQSAERIAQIRNTHDS
ncbi:MULTISPECIES: DUF5753 domain-containing protein [unclassified Streptomyces]|uniref:DUF5753 domain-containing protein n=1 Tax=unclassified Streptomyces TaxID=2593676 RepID=UPI0004CAE3CB|nr:DUF5753 domain-containing protein [Streptomyces sp. NRRL F-5630]